MNLQEVINLLDNLNLDLSVEDLQSLIDYFISKIEEQSCGYDYQFMPQRIDDIALNLLEILGQYFNTFEDFEEARRSILLKKESYKGERNENK